tara:strand:+ start:283 stop:402 length:120 start_codon:yes stop_codon:yes gene_type:complete
MTFFHGLGMFLLGMFLILLASVIILFIVNHLEKRDDEME